MNNSVQKLSDYRILGYSDEDQQELKDRQKSLKLTSVKPNNIIPLSSVINFSQSIHPEFSKEYKRRIKT